jgi:hypothetical protein
MQRLSYNARGVGRFERDLSTTEWERTPHIASLFGFDPEVPKHSGYSVSLLAPDFTSSGFAEFASFELSWRRCVSDEQLGDGRGKVQNAVGGAKDVIRDAVDM